jgi:hypothetical protein
MPWEKGHPVVRPERSREPGSIPGGIEKLSRSSQQQEVRLAQSRYLGCGSGQAEGTAHQDGPILRPERAKSE